MFARTPNFCASFEVLITGEGDLQIVKGINDEYMKESQNWKSANKYNFWEGI